MEWTEEQRAAVAEVLEEYAAEVRVGDDGPRSLDVALDAIWSTVSQSLPEPAAVVRAAQTAKLPAHYQWGHDALQGFETGTRRAADAVAALYAKVGSDG